MGATATVVRNSVQVIENKPARRRKADMTVNEYIDAECQKRATGYVKANRKNPLTRVSYVPFKGRLKGQRIVFGMVACGTYEHGRTCILKEIDESGDLINDHVYRVRENKNEGWETLQIV